MRNVTTKVNGNTLTITCDLGAEKSPSASGKTLIVASTEGNKPVQQGSPFILGLNLYTKK
jgi:hypothetical protein